MPCFTCNGRGCDLCNKRGWTPCGDCPMKLITEDVLDAADLLDFAKQGAFPVTGGVLDQCQSFLDFYRFHEQMVAKFKADRGG